MAVAGANDCIWDWDASSDVAYFSPRWNELVGLPPDAKIESLEDWFERVHQEDIAELRRVMTARPEGERRHIEHEHRLRHEAHKQQQKA